MCILQVFRHLVFDLTGQYLRELYKDEEEEEVEEENLPWMQKPKPLTRNRHLLGNLQAPPTSLDDLRPLVRQHVSTIMGVTEDGKRTATIKAKWLSRKKKDHVDHILIQELREEEPLWVSYEEDELLVKMQLADAIFDSLLAETGKVMMEIHENRASHHS